MKRSLKLILFVLLAILLVVPAQPAAAVGIIQGGQIIIGQSFTLASGDTMIGDLIVLGGSATIEAGASVDGNLVVLGGSLTVSGEVTGDVVIAAGSAALGAAAHLHSDLVTLAASLSRDGQARVDGQVYNTATSWVSSASNGEHLQPAVVLPTPTLPEINLHFGWLRNIANALVQALGLAALAMLLMVFLAPHADRVAHAVLVQPLVAGGIGLLTVVVAPIALTALALLTILIITAVVTVPLIVLLAVALGMACLFGWIAIGYELGQRFTHAIHTEWHPAFSAGLGTFALSLVSLALMNTPVINCIGWLIPTLLGLAALGAVVMTRFGTQAVLAPQPAAAPQAPETPALPPVPVEPAPQAKKRSKKAG